MKEFIEKLIGRLEERIRQNAGWDDEEYWAGENFAYEDAIEIVNELAEEYNNDFCEWEYISSVSHYANIGCKNVERNIKSMRYYKYCPYCGKKIKVIGVEGEQTMAIDEIIEEMRRNDRLLKESEVVLAVQQELMKMGYEPFEERVMGMYKAIDNVSEVCIMEEYDSLYEKANKGGWIPCSERLPEVNGWYLVTNELGIVQQQHWGASHWRKLRDEAVIAWMPLPEPYKGE